MRYKLVLTTLLLTMIAVGAGRTQPIDPGFDPAQPPGEPPAPGPRRVVPRRTPPAPVPVGVQPGAQPEAQPAAPTSDQPAAQPPTASPAVTTESKNITINFPELELEAALKNFSQITGKTFILGEMPKGQIKTVGPIGPVEIPKKYAYDYFVLILQMNGYTVVSTSVPNVYKVIRIADASRDAGLPVYGPNERPRSNEGMVTRFVPVKYVNATELSAQLAQLTSKEGGQVVAYAPTNTLIIMDTAINIERMIKIIRLLDVPTAEPEMEIIKLKYMTAEEASGVLGQVYGASGGSAAPRTATTRELPGRRGRGGAPQGVPVGAQPQPAAPAAGVSDDGGATRIIPIERLNALLVITDADSMSGIKDLIAKIDIDVGMATTIHVYYVQHAEAEELAGTLSGLSGGGSGYRSTSRTSSRSSSRSSTTTGMRPDGMGGVAALPQTNVPAQPRSSGFSGGNILEGMFGGDISINADEATNSLIIVASPQDYEVLLGVIKKLDIPRRQVFVEAVLLEVTYQESQDAGVSLHAASGMDNGGMVFGGTKLSDVSSMTIMSSLASSGGSLTLPSGITVGALGQPVEIPGTDGQVVLPSAGLIVRLLAAESSVNVLSTPTILTTDNQEASIEVGQKIPVPTGQTVSTGGFSNISISRESVGIKLTITPQINESDNIRLDIFTEISGAVSSSLGIDVNSLGVTTSLKTAETSVIVRDSQTIVIGGLMEDRQNASTSKIPWLGDIPVLGWLFKSGSRGVSKTNLIILLTPHIVRSEADVERVKAHIREGYDDIIEENVGSAPDWGRYFDSQLRAQRQGNGEVIDLRDGQPRVVTPPPDWGWTPAEPAADSNAPPAPAEPPPPAAPAPEQPPSTEAGGGN